MMADKDCKDFSSHDAAQAWFIAHGGSPTNNVDRLDGNDHDGIACEYPASWPGWATASTATTAPPATPDTLATTGSPAEMSAFAGSTLLLAGVLIVYAFRYRGKHAASNSKG